jgi:hypothetical protein
MRQPLIVPLFLVWLLSIVNAALGELPREAREKADYVVSGVVDSVYARDKGYYDYYVVELRVESVEKGNELERGKTLYVSCFRRKATAPREPSATGHELPPKEGQRIKAFVKDAKGKHAGIYPDWFDEVKVGGDEK